MPTSTAQGSVKDQETNHMVVTSTQKPIVDQDKSSEQSKRAWMRLILRSQKPAKKIAASGTRYGSEQAEVFGQIMEDFSKLESLGQVKVSITDNEAAEKEATFALAKKQGFIYKFKQECNEPIGDITTTTFRWRADNSRLLEINTFLALRVKLVEDLFKSYQNDMLLLQMGELISNYNTQVAELIKKQN